MCVHLTERQTAQAHEILEQHGLRGRVFAFGSRVRGTYREYSDLDLLIKDESFTTAGVWAVKDDFGESDLPIKVDVLLGHEVDGDFLKIVEAELVPFFEITRKRPAKRAKLTGDSR